MTILGVVGDVCTKIGLTVPTAVYAATTREMVEMKTAIKDAVIEISNGYDWQALKLIHTITGDAATDDWALPTDYDRMLLTASLWTSRWHWGMQHVLDTDDWLEIVTVPYTTIGGLWTIYANQIHILDTMPLNDTAKFFYITNKKVLDNGAVAKEAFTADTDTFRLDEWLLTLCIIWKWKAAKGQPYAEEMASYNQYLATVIKKDMGSKPVISGQPRMPLRSRNTNWYGTVSAAP